MDSSLGNIMIMRQELALIAFLLIMLIASILKKDRGAWPILVFAALTLWGFFPPETGELFGGM